MKAARWVLIAANPNSGSGSSRKLVQSLSDALIQHGFQCEVIGDLEQLQERALLLRQHNKLEAVVSAGGDGTISVLANLLPPDIALLIFPLGTENLLAKYWGLTNDVEFACTTLIGSRTVHMDVGKANGKLFLVMLGCGFDAEVVRQMQLRRTGHIRRWSYAVPILMALKNYTFPQLTLLTRSVQPGSREPAHNSGSQQAAWLFVFNTPRYAANLNFCPQSDPTDGKLDVCTFRRSGIWAGLKYLMALWRGTHQQLADFEHSLTRKLTVPAPLDSAGQPILVPFQLDGDPGGVLPLEIEILPARLKLIVPESTATGDPITELPLAVSST